MIVTAEMIAVYLNKTLYGNDIELQQPASMNHLRKNTLVFAKDYSEESSQILNRENCILAIVHPQFHKRLQCSYILSPRPRLDFARAVQRFFSPPAAEDIAPTARIGRNTVIGSQVSIGEYCVIGNNAVIGTGTRIQHHVVIADHTIIGENCYIKSHSVIGEDGFGFEPDEDNIPIRLPHLGKVILGNHVEVGASAVIARGTLDNTLIDDHVKIDDQVFIAHNVHIGKNSLVIAGAEISGSVRIGSNCWLGPNCCLMNGIEIGSGSLIGIGSTVLHSADSNQVIAGNPAHIIKKK